MCVRVRVYVKSISSPIHREPQYGLRLANTASAATNPSSHDLSTPRPQIPNLRHLHPLSSNSHIPPPYLSNGTARRALALRRRTGPLRRAAPATKRGPAFQTFVHRPSKPHPSRADRCSGYSRASLPGYRRDQGSAGEYQRCATALLLSVLCERYVGGVSVKGRDERCVC